MNKVLINWIDSCADGGSWCYESLEDINCPDCESIGYIEHENEDRIILIQTQGNEGKLNWVAIPKCSITGRVELVEGELID